MMVSKSYYNDGEERAQNSNNESLLVEALRRQQQPPPSAYHQSISGREGEVKTTTASSQIPPPPPPPTIHNQHHDPLIPRNSDVTVEWNNVSKNDPRRSLSSPRSSLTKDRRQVFGGRAEVKYNVANNNNGQSNHLSSIRQQHNNGAISVGNHQSDLPPLYHHSNDYHTANGSVSNANDGTHPYNYIFEKYQQNQYDNTVGSTPLKKNYSSISSDNYDVNSSPEMSFTPPASQYHKKDNARDLLSPPSKKNHKHHGDNNNNTNKTEKSSYSDTLHAQCLVLGIAFMAAWFPQNLMAPNLTEMAQYFGFASSAERDFYLGANIALATGVLSFPIAAGIGILADVWNRKYLYCATIALGGVSAFFTGASTSYHLLFWARLLNGSFMSGSVPIAFSLLGDLFDTNERNAASSGLTAMMGLGIILGQVYAGVVGSSEGWSHPFYVSAILSLVSALFVLLLVKEPIRGGKEQVLQDMLRDGKRYERKLTWDGFVATMSNNKSNLIIISQGFFTSIPWGIIFVFLNDYLSQERGFSVPDATYLVAVFGIGCAAGGILGGYWGQVFQSWNRSYLALYMSVSTFLGVFPFLGLLNGTTRNAHGIVAAGFSFSGGCIASLPSVCVRPVLINVNPPETRGAALTAANLVIQLARGAGPSCITLLGSVFGLKRQLSFSVTLAVFWTISAIQLIFLAKTLPKDEDKMNAELAEYAANAVAVDHRHGSSNSNFDDLETPVSIEDRISSWDAAAARESMQFFSSGLKEIREEIQHITPLPMHCGNQKRIRCGDDVSSSEDSSSVNAEDDDDDDIIERQQKSRRSLLKQKQSDSPYNWRGELPDETTPLGLYSS